MVPQSIVFVVPGVRVSPSLGFLSQTIRVGWFVFSCGIGVWFSMFCEGVGVSDDVEFGVVKEVVVGLGVGVDVGSVVVVGGVVGVAVGECAGVDVCEFVGIGVGVGVVVAALFRIVIDGVGE